MANRVKTKPKNPSPDKLNEEQEAKVSVSEFVKDERTYKITGVAFLLIGFFLLISFVSYLFTWQSDQSKIQRISGIKIFGVSDIKASNLFGILGAYVSHSLIYNGFGIASFLLFSVFFIAGINLLFGRKVFSLARNLRYTIVGLLVISVALALLNLEILHSNFSWGGAVGELMCEWLMKWIGALGAVCAVAAAVLAYLIWRINPVFS
jgi:S-DNA-T family DNA segregation ATPase FtsK/SpoIIIE